MAFDPPQPASRQPIPGATPVAAPPVLDEDDGIRIASIRREEFPDGAVLHVTIVWFEEGRRVGTVVRVPEGRGHDGRSPAVPPAPDPPSSPPRSASASAPPTDRQPLESEVP